MNAIFAGLLLPARHTNQSPTAEEAVNSKQASDEIAYLTKHENFVMTGSNNVCDNNFIPL